MGKYLLNWLLAILIFSLSVLLMIFVGLNWSVVVEISLIFGQPVTLPVIYLLFLSFFTGGCFGCICLLSSHRLQHLFRQQREKEKEARRQKKIEKKNK